MNRASKNVSTWSRHVKSNRDAVFRVEKDTPHTSAVHNYPILFHLCRNSLKHGRAEVVSLRVFIPYLNDSGIPQTQRALFCQKTKILDRHLDHLFGLCLKDCAIHPSQTGQGYDRSQPPPRHQSSSNGHGLLHLFVSASICVVGRMWQAARSVWGSSPCERLFPPYFRRKSCPHCRTVRSSSPSRPDRYSPCAQLWRFRRTAPPPRSGV